MKPLIAFRYYGGKNHKGVSAWIRRLLPIERGYVEPFSGSAAILLNRPICKFEMINDMDGRVTNFFRLLRNPETERKLIRALELTPSARDELNYCKRNFDKESNGSVESARQFFTLSMQGFMSIQTKDVAWSTSYTGTGPPSNASSIVNTISQLNLVAERLRLVQIENKDARFICKRAMSKNNVLYIDPPYDEADQAYRHKVDPDYHRELAEILTSAKDGKFALSSYNTSLMRELYPPDRFYWHFYKRNKYERGGTRQEILICNYPQPFEGPPRGWPGK